MRICGICKRSPREDDPMTDPIRLQPSDIDGEKDSQGNSLQPGLQIACRDCYEHFRPIIHRRTAANPPPNANGYRELPDGSPAVVVPPLEQFHGAWLM